MTLNSGLGAVTTKNVLLLEHVAEQLTACYHQNKKDIWVITHAAYGSGFFSFLVTENGVSTEPIRSVSLCDKSEAFNSLGSLKVSPNGKKIAITTLDACAELMCFNNGTGRLCRNMVLTEFFPEGYGIEFSNNSSKLYIQGYRLSQYDLTEQWNSIPNTEIIIAPDRSGLPVQMQLAADGSIYFPNVGRIQYPNISGVGCNFDSSFYVFPIPGQGTLGISNFITSYFDTDTLELDTTSCECNEPEATLKIPNVITPNGDEVNQSLTFQDENFTNYSLWVYNRWGEVVFQTTDPSIPFVGKTTNGTKLSDGTYYITVKYLLKGTIKQQEYHGSLLVLADQN